MRICRDRLSVRIAGLVTSKAQRNSVGVRFITEHETNHPPHHSYDANGFAAPNATTHLMTVAVSRFMGRFFFRYSARSRDGFFGAKYLGQRLRDDEYPGFADIDSGCVIRTQLPAWCARADRRPPLAAMLALLDEASTCTIAMHDRSARFGVSVRLSGTLATKAPVISANTSMTVRTQIRKIGKNLAFVDVLLCAGPEEQLILRCEHIKFMPRGLFLDNIGHPFMRSIVETYYKAFLSKNPINAFDHPQQLRFDDVFALEDIVVDEEAATSTANLVLSREHCNPVGDLHGGAACLLVEHLAKLATAQNYLPVAFNLNLMSGIKPGERLTINAKSYTDPIHKQETNQDSNYDRAAAATILKADGSLAFQSSILFQSF